MDCGRTDVTTSMIVAFARCRHTQDHGERKVRGAV